MFACGPLIDEDQCMENFQTPKANIEITETSSDCQLILYTSPNQEGVGYTVDTHMDVCVTSEDSTWQSYAFNCQDISDSTQDAGPDLA